MTKQSLNINYEVYNSINELTDYDKELANSAVQAMSGAYAPYSNFTVGAAVRLNNGEIIKGANQENMAYPSGLCAERTAMFAAGANFPNNNIVSIALAGGPSGAISNLPTTPCGACRQVMAEYQAKAKQPISIIMVGKEQIWKFACINDILPLIFDGLN